MADQAPLLDLSALDFAPSWAKGGEDAPKPAPARESQGPKPQAPSGHARAPRPLPPREGRDRRPPMRDRGERGARHEGPRGRGPREKFSGPRRDERPTPPPNPFPWLRINFAPTGPAIETVVQQVRHTGKTFALFDIARILLRNPKSYTLELSCVPPAAEGPFHVVPGDGSVWMSMQGAVRHVLETRMTEFYTAEAIEVPPPKGNFPVVAVCGMSGTVLGPPNHHDFERRVRELHRTRFARMEFEQFRARLRMERDPEVVEKWRAEASRTTVYRPVGEGETETLENLAAVEKHFLATHAAAQIKSAPTASIPGDPKATTVDSSLVPLLAHACEEEIRFPLRLAQSLSRALSGAGLRFHKSPTRTTFVSAARHRHLDLTQVVVSDSIRRIFEAIRSKPSLRRLKLLEQLAPLPAPAPAETPVERPAPDATQVAAAAEASPASPPPSPEQAARDAVVQDLLWLTHEGYVIEYSDGRLESVPPPKHPPAAAKEAATEAGEQIQQPEA